jgi:hypothetical protein
MLEGHRQRRGDVIRLLQGIDLRHRGHESVQTIPHGARPGDYQR